MERKIGEIFEYDGKWYQCVELPSDYIGCICNICSMNFDGKCPLPIRECQDENGRSDHKDVIFKKLEKLGEPCHFGKKLMQTYKLFTKAVTPLGLDCFTIRAADDSSIKIELKQTKEDMEEKKLNLKEFDLEQAKAGKPVCTRDGRKARIVCYDRKSENYPILALVENNSNEQVVKYTTAGKKKDQCISPYDLMMLPEKHEGWVNIYKVTNGYESRSIYTLKEDAIKKITGAGYVATVRIEWEE